MDLRRAYTALLIQFPPLSVGIAAGVAGFLGAALPALRLARIGAGLDAVEEGLRWAALVGGAAAFTVGLVALWGLSRADAGRAARLKAALSLVSVAVVGPVAAWGGTGLGATLGAQASGLEVLEAVAAGWWLVWPVVAIPVALAAALAGTAVEAGRVG
jgi:hypothetical protein